MATIKRFARRVAVPAFTALAVVMLASLLYGLNLKEKVGTDTRPIQQRGTMLQTLHKTTGHAAVPPIDAAAPKEFETATFAQG
jgi:hypothetical protein